MATAQTAAIAPVSRTTQAADDVCLQRLDKTLDALENAEALIAAKDAQIKAKNDLLATKDAIIAQRIEIQANTEKLLEIYKAKSQRKISFLFGLVKIRY